MEPVDIVDDLLHAETQVHEDGRVDLTVADVEEVVEPGRIDFGGGELAPARTVAHDAEYRDPDDEYAWWTLAAGQYLCSFNETVADGRTVLVQPRDELLERGGTLPTVRTDEPSPLPLSVGGAGLRCKENARVATVVDVLE